MACKQTFSCSLVLAEWLLFARLPWLSSSQGLSGLKQCPHSLLCTPRRLSLSIATDVWLCISALWFFWGMHLGKTAKPICQCLSLSPLFPFFSYLPQAHSKLIQGAKPAENWPKNSKKYFFSKFSSLNQPTKGQMDTNAISRDIWSGDGVGMPVPGRSSHLCCKTTAFRSSWRLADHCCPSPAFIASLLPQTLSCSWRRVWPLWDAKVCSLPWA